MYSLAFLIVFAIFMMTELSYDIRCDSAGNATAGEALSFFNCLQTPYDCLLIFFSCHWAEMATLLCMINNIVDELRQVHNNVCLVYSWFGIQFWKLCWFGFCMRGHVVPYRHKIITSQFLCKSQTFDDCLGKVKYQTRIMKH